MGAFFFTGAFFFAFAADAFVVGFALVARAGRGADGLAPDSP
jgi:hypothetical protein